MTDDNSFVDIEDDLNEFADEFFERKQIANAEEGDDEQEPNDLGEDDDSENPPATDEDDKPKGKKSVQERINELTADKYTERRAREAAEERAAELEARLEELTAKSKPESDEKKAPIRERLPSDAPHPDAKDENGEPLYALGEFDPEYIRDLTKYTIKQETEAANAERARIAQEQEMQAALAEVQENWLERVSEFEKEVPDFRDKAIEVTEAFATLPEAYGEYLATAVMSSEYGPQIMNYLSENIGEAQKYVASGPAAATMYLGRLEAQFAKPSASKRKVSDAPEPPESRTRGLGGKFAVAGDTDNLDAFAKEFFKK